MRILSLLPLLLFFTFNLNFSEVDQQKSFKYESEISDINIKFPGKPEHEVKDRPEGTIEMVAFEDSKMEYTMEIRKAKDISMMEEDLLKMGTRYEAARKIAANFHANKQGYTEKLVRKDWKVKKYKGQMVTFTAVRYDYHYRVLVMDDIVVQLTVKARGAGMGTSDYDDKKAMKFANSFSLK